MPKINASLRSRVYFSMLAIILLSLVIIGATTLLFFSNENEEYHQERLKRKEATVAKSLQYFLKEIDLEGNIDFVRQDFENKVIEIADINNIDINVFNTRGEILMSSIEHKAPDFYNLKIDSSILNELRKKGKRIVIEEDKENMSTYDYIRNDEGENVAIINIPYNLKNMPAKDDIGPFLTTLLEVYVLLLIGASIIAYFLSNYITKSIRLVGEKLKLVDINKKNDPIQWEGNDEIGVLVEQYNKMIKELERSADELAKTQREFAWREMAKQVAHEIKNPLTPMKLSVQHLERSLNQNDVDFDEKLHHFTSKMIQQIDTLTSIANEFSNFAKMPKAIMTEMDVIEVLTSSIGVFSESENVNIIFQNQLKQAMIKGDKEQLIRVFNNLIKNAIQSIPDNKTGEIEISLEKKDSFFVISIQDNGSGIPNELLDKIFVPNFTTKSTGTGLGLAMVKQILEGHNGSISFLTKVDEGTIFIVKLPKL